MCVCVCVCVCVCACECVCVCLREGGGACPPRSIYIPAVLLGEPLILAVKPGSTFDPSCPAGLDCPSD